MSDYVVFEHDRIAAFKWNSDLKKDEEVPFHLSDLRCRVKVSDGVTLGEIFESVDRHPDLKEVIAKYAWCSAIDAFHADARKPREEDDDGRLAKLVVSAYGEIFEHEEDKDFNLCLDFIGVDEKDQRWSVSYTPMYRLAHLPVVIDEEFTIRRNWTETVATATRVFTVLEFLEAIYWDISFHGGPEENVKFLEELKESIREIDEGRAKLVPFEDVMRELEDQE